MHEPSERFRPWAAAAHAPSIPVPEQPPAAPSRPGPDAPEPEFPEPIPPEMPSAGIEPPVMPTPMA